MKKLLYIVFFLCLTGYAQHNIVYSQYYFSGVLINPAYAGSQNALNITSIYRSQWSGVEGAPKNISIGIHSPLKNDKTNLGLIILNNKYGITCESKIMGIYAYKLKLSKGHLSFGLQGGVEYFKNDWTKVQSTDSNDPVFENNAEKRTSAIFGAGIFYKTEKMFIGLSAPVIYNTRKDYILSSNPYIFSVGYLYNINENFLVKPAGLIRYIKGSPVEGDFSTAFYYKEIIGVGVGYRTKAAVYGYLDIRLNDQFSAGYCYDYSVTRLNAYSIGSHEIMLRYLFSYKVNMKSVRYF